MIKQAYETGVLRALRELGVETEKTAVNWGGVARHFAGGAVPGALVGGISGAAKAPEGQGWGGFARGAVAGGLVGGTGNAALERFGGGIGGRLSSFAARRPGAGAAVGAGMLGGMIAAPAIAGRMAAPEQTPMQRLQGMAGGAFGKLRGMMG